MHYYIFVSQHDGGKPITHYIVEKKDKTSGKWTPVSKFCRGTGCEVNDLEDGEEYEFRVSAVNELGPGDHLVTDKPIIAKYQFGETVLFYHWLFTCKLGDRLFKQ